MDPIKLKIKNYRSVPNDSPITLTLKEGIQFIVGINNVGKSNLLRVFTELRECFYRPYNIQSNGKAYIDLKIPFDAIVNQNSPESPITISFQYKDLSETITVSPSNPNYLHSTQIELDTSYGLRNDEKNLEVKTKVMEMVSLITRSMYIGASRVSITQATGKHFDLDIGQSFFAQWASWASNGERRKMIKIDLLISELKELFGFEKLQIQVSQNASDMIITNEEGAFSLNELGSGISHYILSLGGATFFEPSFIFIDEPETGLHPRMQEMFVRALAAKAKYGLIATSHSISLARSVADEIHTLTKEKGKPKLVPFGRHYHTTIGQSVSEMGFSQYVELGGNNILLVEGRTEIKCFREILRKWGIDKDFIVISLGGSDFITENPRIADELNELKRLNAKSISVIFDSELTSKSAKLPTKLLGFKKTCESLGFKVFTTEFHSTENYVSQNAISGLLGSQYKALKPFENFNSSKFKWPKDKNWLLFREMKKDDFEGTELKKFIETYLVPLANN